MFVEFSSCWWAFECPKWRDGSTESFAGGREVVTSQMDGPLPLSACTADPEAGRDIMAMVGCLERGLLDSSQCRLEPRHVPRL